jgi:hypothetical protein
MKTRQQLRDEGIVNGCTCSPNFNFEDCCDMHDYLYWRGGKWGDRERADELLRECIAKKGHPVLAWVYWTAVRLFGVSHFSKIRQQAEAINDVSELPD